MLVNLIYSCNTKQKKINIDNYEQEDLENLKR